MKLKQGFITHMSGDKQIMVDAMGSQFSGIVRSNKTAAFIVDSLKNETTKEAIVQAMLEKYDAPKEKIEKDVSFVIDRLKSIGAIDE